MGGNKVLQYVQSFTEVGLDGKLDGVSCGIRHQSAHTCQLLNLLIRTTGAGVSHHVDIVVLIQAGQQVVGQLVIGGLPGLDYLFVTLLLSDEAAAVVLGNLIHGCLGILNQPRLACRHGHVGNRYGHGCPGGIFVTDCLDIIQGHGCLGSAMDIDDFLKYLL